MISKINRVPLIVNIIGHMIDVECKSITLLYAPIQVHRKHGYGILHPNYEDD